MYVVTYCTLHRTYYRIYSLAVAVLHIQYISSAGSLEQSDTGLGMGTRCVALRTRRDGLSQKSSHIGLPPIHVHVVLTV